MDRLRAHFGRRSGRRQFAVAFAGILGILWLGLEPAGLFFPDEFDWGWGGYLGLVATSLVLAGYHARPRSTVSRLLPPTDVAIRIEVGDVLVQTGNVVVGTNDTFDTQPEDGVISATSVQGQLLVRTFGGDRLNLDQQIEKSLDTPGRLDSTKTFGKLDRFPIGTVAIVHRGPTRYFLPAFTTMSPTLPAHVRSSAEDLQVALAQTWKTINAAGQREPVHVPVIGSHLARLGLSRTLLIQMIVLSFIAATRTGGPSHLTVWISPQDKNVVDIAVLDEWLRGLCAV